MSSILFVSFFFFGIILFTLTHIIFFSLMSPHNTSQPMTQFTVLAMSLSLYSFILSFFSDCFKIKYFYPLSRPQRCEQIQEREAWGTLVRKQFFFSEIFLYCIFLGLGAQKLSQCKVLLCQQALETCSSWYFSFLDHCFLL